MRELLLLANELLVVQERTMLHITIKLHFTWELLVDVAVLIEQWGMFIKVMDTRALPPVVIV